MKMTQKHQQVSSGYETPCILTTELVAAEILCTSNWNDGSISDVDENWNVVETL